MKVPLVKFDHICSAFGNTHLKVFKTIIKCY